MSDEHYTILHAAKAVFGSSKKPNPSDENTPPIDPDLTRQHLVRLILLGVAMWGALLSIYIARLNGHYLDMRRGNLIDGAAIVWPFFWGFLLYSEYRRKRKEKNTLKDERDIPEEDRHGLFK